MKRNRAYEWMANLVLVVMLCAVTAAAFTGSYYGAILDKEAYAPIYKGADDGNKVTFMINVYWGTEYVLEMARIFKSYGFNTTFFLGGSWAAENVDIVQSLSSQGFELGNHGYSHRDHSKLNYEGNKKEITVTENLIRKITGTEPVKLFAPPSGAMSEVMHKFCEEAGYRVIMWTRDTIDWRDKDADITYARAIKNLKSGDLVLMHPTAHTLKALPSILEYVKNNGFTAVAVSDNIA